MSSVKLEASGVNFIDVYHRTGLYKLPLPFSPGMEGAGIVEEIGSEVIDWKPGDRVAWAMVPGAYAEYAALPSAKLVRVPEGVDTRTAAALMLQGMTAHYLTRSTFPLKKGDTALVHAAAGGAGLLLPTREVHRRPRDRHGLHGSKGPTCPRRGSRRGDPLHGAGLRGGNQADDERSRRRRRLRFGRSHHVR